MEYKEKLVIPYKKEEAYNLIAKVEDYPAFVPWCKSATLVKTEDGFEFYKITVKFGFFTQSFVTKDLFTPHDRIEIHAVEGPFEHLYSLWQFKDVSTGEQSQTEVEFFIDFNFKSSLLNKTLGKVFVEANKQILSSFLNKLKK